MQNKKVEYKMENNEFKKFCVNNLTFYYVDDIIRLEDFDFNDISVDEKPH